MISQSTLSTGKKLLRLEKYGVHLYYDDVDELWFFFDEVKEEYLLVFKDSDKDKVIEQVYDSTFKSLGTEL